MDMINDNTQTQYTMNDDFGIFAIVVRIIIIYGTFKNEVKNK